MNDIATLRWNDLIYRTFFDGAVVSSRGFTCRERTGAKIEVPIEFPIILSRRRKLGYAFMCAEAAWILSGDDRVELIKPYSKTIASFSDDGQVFYGAYGPKIYRQLNHVLRALSEDTGSRQAVINIWRENPQKSKDIPCTVSAQWLIRDNRLHCFSNMRSSDVWLGVPYDIFNFSVLSVYIAKRLRESGFPKLALGNMTLYAVSSHLYERDWLAAREIAHFDELIDEPPFNYQEVVLDAPHEMLMASLYMAANRIMESKR